MGKKEYDMVVVVVSACKNSLAQGGFFCKDGDYYCTTDYQRQFGTKCSHCGEYVEGEVVTALGNTYHQKCFTCGRCRWVWQEGEGREVGGRITVKKSTLFGLRLRTKTTRTPFECWWGDGDGVVWPLFNHHNKYSIT